MEGKLSAIMKILDQESARALQYSKTVFNELKMKHPSAATSEEESLLNGPLARIPEYYFDSIDERDVFSRALRMKGSAGPSGMDADLY